MKLLVHKDSQDSEAKEQLQSRSDEGQNEAKGERKLMPRSLSAPTITSKRQYAHPINSEKENWDPVKLIYTRDIKRTKKSTLIRKPLADITALYQSTRKINGEFGLSVSERSKQVLVVEKGAIRSKSVKNRTAQLIDISEKTTEKYPAAVSNSKPNAEEDLNIVNKNSASTFNDKCKRAKNKALIQKELKIPAALMSSFFKLHKVGDDSSATDKLESKGKGKCPANILMMR